MEPVTLRRFAQLRYLLVPVQLRTGALHLFPALRGGPAGYNDVARSQLNRLMTIRHEVVLKGSCVIEHTEDSGCLVSSSVLARTAGIYWTNYPREASPHKTGGYRTVLSAEEWLILRPPKA